MQLFCIQDPVKSKRERIEKGEETELSPPKQQVTMRSPVDLQRKRSKFEDMERAASEVCLINIEHFRAGCPII